MNLLDPTVITIYADGRTEPSIPPETVLIKIEDGEVSLCKIVYEPDEYFDFYFAHPKNHNELNNRALRLVTEQKPEYLKSEVCLFIICPSSLADETEW